MEKDLNKLKKIEWDKKLVLLILSGRDNGSLKLIYEYFLTTIDSKVYIICSKIENLTILILKQCILIINFVKEIMLIEIFD